jgi:hypothetical protein
MSAPVSQADRIKLLIDDIVACADEADGGKIDARHYAKTLVKVAQQAALDEVATLRARLTQMEAARPTAEQIALVERVPCRRCHDSQPSIDGEVGCKFCIESPFGPTWLARRVPSAEQIALVEDSPADQLIVQLLDKLRRWSDGDDTDKAVIARFEAKRWELIGRPIAVTGKDTTP